MLACEPPVVDGGEEGGVLCGEVERLCNRWRWKSPRNTLPTLFELIDCAIRVDYFGDRDGKATQRGLQQSNNIVHKGVAEYPVEMLTRSSHKIQCVSWLALEILIHCDLISF